MTDPFDRDLARLASLAPPDSLHGLEDRVASAIGADVPAGRSSSLRGMAVAGSAALLLGLAGGGVMAGRIEARERQVALVALDAGLAPSTLLLGR
jgi:hypothetical protein